MGGAALMSVSFPIVLVGLPGVGKTTLGGALARLLGVEHLDTDHLIEERVGCSVAQFFAAEGEQAFRECEVQVVEEVLRRQAVISLGGGAVTQARVRQLLRGHTVVHLRAPVGELLSRVLQQPMRPLLRQDPEATLRRLEEQRHAFFREVRTYVVDSSAGSVAQVVENLHSIVSGAELIRVQAEHEYDVVFSADSARVVADLLPSDVERVLVVHPPVVADFVKKHIEVLRARGFECFTMTHPEGEEAKTLEVLAQGWQYAGQARLSRTDVVIAIGGGATTDLGGFLAATWLRGVRVVHVPTSVLGAVDAAVGGKTGINTDFGKNLVGAFHSPLAVVIDMSVFHSLPPDVYRAGLAEVLKCGLIADSVIIERCLENTEALFDPSSRVFREVMRRAIAVKGRVVGVDVKESGLREVLNYGHTLAHAIERVENYRWSHGQAVSVGCVFAAELARDLGLLSENEVALHRQLFEMVGLPVSYCGVAVEDLIRVMFSDKKVRHGQLRFVLLHGIGHPHTVQVSESHVRAVAQRLGMS